MPARSLAVKIRSFCCRMVTVRFFLVVQVSMASPMPNRNPESIKTFGRTSVSRSSKSQKSLCRMRLTMVSKTEPFGVSVSEYHRLIP